MTKNQELGINIASSFLASILLTALFYMVPAFGYWQLWPETSFMQDAAKQVLRLIFISSLLYGIMKDLTKRFCK